MMPLKPNSIPLLMLLGISGVAGGGAAVANPATPDTARALATVTERLQSAVTRRLGEGTVPGIGIPDRADGRRILAQWYNFPNFGNFCIRGYFRNC
jgi:hypothetical protein